MSSWHRAVVERHDGETLTIEAGTRVECTVALADWVRENWVNGDSAYVCKVNYYVLPDGLLGGGGKISVAEALTPPSRTSGAARRRKRAAARAAE